MPDGREAAPRQLALIVCRARNGVIGRDGALPWHLPGDLARFKRRTMGHALVMGRRTHESIGRALPGRRNLVLSRDPDYRPATGAEAHPDLPAALAAAWETDACPFVIGGAAVYAAALPMATVLYVSEVPEDVEGDVHFPAIDPARFEVVESEPGDGFVTFTWRLRPSAEATAASLPARSPATRS